jgi:hypothetical protein
MNRKVVINVSNGGFGLSDKARQLAKQLGRNTGKYADDIQRDDPVLVQVVEQLGEEANCRFSKLKVVEIPSDVQWEIAEYAGNEWVSEKHRTWR